MVRTQVYGLTTVADAVAVDRLGADHVGLVLDEGIDTWDSVDERRAREIAAAVRHARLVALSLSTDAARIRTTVAVTDPAVVHLARAFDMPDHVLEQLRDELAPAELMLTVPVRDEAALVAAARLAPLADHLLLDSAHPDTGVVGASGHVHDWSLSARVVAAVDVPVWLAGGLGPANVAEAIATVQPAGVDSETRTSRVDDRRRKDLDAVEAFLAAARAASPR